MSADFQKILVQLYTCKDMRNEFSADKKRFNERHNLQSCVCSALEKVNVEELEYFSRSLLRKRFVAAADYYPATHYLLGKESETLFNRFAENLPPAGINKHLNDAILFLKFLSEKGRFEKAVIQMAQYESKLLQENSGLQIMKADFDLPAIRAAICKKTTPDIRRGFRILILKNRKLTKNISFTRK